VDRRAFIVTAAGFLAAPLAAEAKQAGKLYRVGYLSAGSQESSEHLNQAFLRGLRELGWIEGQDLIVERRWAEGKNERLPALAAELVQRKVDVIVASAESAALAAKNATSTVPIVILFVGDPVGSKLVASLARPEGNVTGVTFTPTLELLGKRLALLKEAVPHASRVAILSNPANPSHARELREVEAAARALPAVAARKSRITAPPWSFASGRTLRFIGGPRSGPAAATGCSAAARQLSRQLADTAAFALSKGVANQGMVGYTGLSNGRWVDHLATRRYKRGCPRGRPASSSMVHATRRRYGRPQRLLPRAAP
jgi:hypothetical protein